MVLGNAMKKLGQSLLLMSLANFGFANTPQVWDLDPSHSSITFTVVHLGITKTAGKFEKYETNVSADKTDFTDAKFDVVIQTNSINTSDSKRDEHLKGKDFFDVEKNPTIKFEGMKFEKKKNKKNEYNVTGKLTMNGVTKDVVLVGKFNGIQKDNWGGTKAGLEVTGEINRYDYNLKYNSVLDTGGLTISKEVKIFASLELNKKASEVKKEEEKKI